MTPPFLQLCRLLILTAILAAAACSGGGPSSPALSSNSTDAAATGTPLAGSPEAAATAPVMTPTPTLPDRALRPFEAYAQSGRPAAPCAQYDRALAFLDLGQPATAALAAQNGLNAALPDAAKNSFRLLAAQSYERANQTSDALRW